MIELISDVIYEPYVQTIEKISENLDGEINSNENNKNDISLEPKTTKPNNLLTLEENNVGKKGNYVSLSECLEKFMKQFENKISQMEEEEEDNEADELVHFYCNITIYIGTFRGEHS